MAVRDPLVPPVHGHHLIHPEPAPPDAAEQFLGHHFARPGLLREAMTHRSAMQNARGGRLKGAKSNERLEFIGDRVLGLLMAEWLAERFPGEQEGGLGRRLAHLVSQPVLAEIAEQAGLASALSVAPGESRAGVRKLATVLADAMEAVIGALYLDGGIEAARRFVRRAWEPAMVTQADPPIDAKSGLQEWAAANGFKPPVYRVVTNDGPPHAPVFAIMVTVADQTGEGRAGSKRGAEKLAAEHLMRKLAP